MNDPTPLLPNLKRVASTVFNPFPGVLDKDDLVNEAVLDLLQRPYDPSRGSYEAFCITFGRWAMINAIRRVSWVPPKIKRKAGHHSNHTLQSLDEPQLITDEPLDVAAEGYTPPDDSPLWLMLLRLPNRERFVIWAHYFDGRYLEDIARELGVTTSRVSQLHRRALEAMRASDPRRAAAVRNGSA